jgi:Tol biopolymer transport system component
VARAEPPVEFEGRSDVGKITLPGSLEVDAAKGQIRMTGSGANMWASLDAFYFAWRRISGDLELTSLVDWPDEGKQAHRKAGWLVRQDLEPDSPYADAIVHGDGSIALQYRRTKGGATAEIKSPVKAPAKVRLQRNGDVFSLSVASADGPFQPAGALTIALQDPVYAGLVVCSHDAATSETAVFSSVDLKNRVLEPGERRVRESSLETIAIETGQRNVVYRAREHFEAPNWSRDGARLLFNQQGGIYTLPIAGAMPTRLDTGTATRCNNDHGLSPDGKWLAISHANNRQSFVSILPSGGGAPRLVTQVGPSYWHGWSPDGKTLVYCGQRNGEGDIYSIPVAGGKETRLTMAPGLDDGPDYTPDGKRIYFNSVRKGLMKIWRMNGDGSNQEQVTTDANYADWFPHPSPDGKWLVFLSYDKSVKEHPPDKDVLLRIMPLEGGQPKVLATLFGGQGTINVPSWSPDSKKLAFVSYRLVAP